MEWNKSDKYFFKLDDGSCLTGEIKGIRFFGDTKSIVINDKFDREVGFRESRIVKYELLSKVNKVNNQS